MAIFHKSHWIVIRKGMILDRPFDTHIGAIAALNAWKREHPEELDHGWQIEERKVQMTAKEDSKKADEEFKAF